MINIDSMPKLNVYNLGSLGIDIVNSPLHVADGSLITCQNAQVSPDNADLSLKKRDGMSKINSTAAAGSLLAILNVPIS